MEEKNVSRRKFIQGGAVLGAALGLSSLAKPDEKRILLKLLGLKNVTNFLMKF